MFAVNIYRVWALGSNGFQLLMVIGIAGAVFGWRTGAYLMIAGFAGLVATHSSVALVEYRRVMSRPWPKVAPLDDDDW